jgi:acid stress-induced BolA-like protein IbaG/YrbA
LILKEALNHMTVDSPILEHLRIHAMTISFYSDVEKEKERQQRMLEELNNCEDTDKILNPGIPC